MNQELEEIYNKWIKDGVLVNAQSAGTSMIYIREIDVPVPKQKQGRGTKIINELKAVAKNHGSAIYLEPSSNMGNDLKTLRKIYVGWGFIPEDGNDLESTMWYPELP